MNEAAREGIVPRSISLELNLYTSDDGPVAGEDGPAAVSPDPGHPLPGRIAPETWQSWFHIWLNTLTWEEMPYLERAIAATDGQIVPQDDPEDDPEDDCQDDCQDDPENGLPNGACSSGAVGAIVCELSLQLLDDAAIHQLNATYRQVDRPTDVLAFAALETPLPPIAMCGPAIADPVDLGDIAISLDTAARQADERGHPLTVELAWLAAHGLLHLLGWDHPDDASLAAMLACQDRLLRAIALTAAV
jgi:probable rRNA maturation factor